MLIERLRERAESDPRRRAYTFLTDGEVEEATLTYGELDRRARAIAAALAGAGHGGERALLVYPPGLEFVAAFLGCLYGGVVAVPAYPPGSRRTLPRLAAIVADARPAVVLTAASHLERFRSTASPVAELASLPWMATDEAPAELAEGWRPGPAEADAFLQYTSGSTSAPKGVRVTHANLAANEAMIQRAFGISEESVIVGWLPFYHDMGLIGNVLQPLWAGAECVLMSPWAFLQKPLRWLAAIGRFRGTTSGGPNFAYDLCVRKVSPAEIEGLDLASWRVAFNGAEPVRAATLERFAASFAPAGFRSEAFFPCYGLAEATLFVAGGEVAAAPRQKTHEGRRRVGCGAAPAELELAVVDPATATPCLEGRVGEIWVAGPSVARGYWQRPAASEAAFGARLAGGEGPYLRTGDLGFVAGGELFVTGRLKDLVILRGRNLYPQDLEWSSEGSHAALRSGGGAAFAVDAEDGERLVVVQEVERRREAEAAAAAVAVRRAVAEEHEARVEEVVIVRAGTVPKTSSGKVRRAACRAAYLAGELKVIAVARAEAVDEAADEALGLTRESLAALPEAERGSVLESYLRELVAGAIQIAAAEIDPTSPLTALGLDSLAAVEIQHRLESELEVEVQVTELLAGASLEETAALVNERLAGAAPRSGGLAPTLPEGDQPLAPGQEALWFLSRLAPAATAYHLAGAARVRGGLDTAALGRAFDALVERHAGLRTTFHAVDGRPRQRIGAGSGGFVIERAAGWSEERLRGRLAAEAYRPFDLEEGPLVRLLVLEVSAREHRLLLAVHHLVADLWSLSVLLHDLGRLYAGAPLEPLAATYADWIRRQRQLLAGPEGKRLERYWTERLAGVPQELELATDRPRPLTESFRGSRVTRSLPAADVHAFARESGATIFMALLAAFQALLHRYSGQRAFLVGSPAAGRPSFDLEDLVGYFVNPLALAADLSGRPSGRELLARVRTTVLEGFEHQSYPFPRLAERLRPRRDPARSPLFQVMLALQKAQQPGGEALAAFALGVEGVELSLGGMELESLALEHRGAAFELSLLAAEWDARLLLALELKTDLWDATTARRFLGHFDFLLRALAADPDSAVAELPILAAGERHQLLADWSRSARSYPVDLTLAALFARQVYRAPEAAAVVSPEGTWTYGELDRRSSRLAHRLRRLGVGPEVPVAVGVERGPELVAALFGVWKAGGVYVPLDPELPEERRAFVLEDTGSPVLLTGEPLATGDAEPSLLTAVVEPRNLAYVIYTSGSTGRPKGVAISHRSLAPTLFWARDFFGFGSHTRVLHTLSPSFDFGVFEILTTVLFGGTFHMLGPGDLADPTRYARYAATRDIETIHATPSFIRAVVAAGESLRGLSILHLGGEALTREYLEGLFPALDSACAVYNGYGPTEATINTTIFRVDRRRLGGATPIGRASANHRVYVVDGAGEPLPAGAPGELVVGGEGVARGYLKRPALTAERFVPDPFEPGRLYRTGDRVRHLAGGEIEFLGRFDDQVKVRGFRVEPGEIEAALAAERELAQAAVVDVAGPGGGADRRLVAFVVPRREIAAAELRRRLEERLPAYMVPSAIVELQSLPATASGKVDRRALRRAAPEPEGAAFVAPRTAVEEVLAAIWSEVLGRRVGVHDDFFALGGHSLLAAQVAARIRDALGVEIELRRLFERPTVAALAAAPELGSPAVRSPAPPLVPGAGAAPLSFAQERLWFLDQLEPGGTAYHMAAVVLLRGRLRERALRAALNEIVRRHEALRTRFETVAGEPVQIVEPPAAIPLPQVDLDGTRHHVLDLARREARRAFDLRRGPLLRAALVRLAATEHALVVVLHHVVFDGWSTGVLLTELAAHYAGRPPAPLPIQYADYARWQRRWLTGEALERQLEHWRRRLAGVPALELPTDRPRRAGASRRGATLPVRLPAGLSGGLAAAGRRQGATLFMTLLASFAALLGRLSGQSDFAVGTPVAHRRRTETEGLIGFFVNTLALRADLGGRPGFAELLRRVRETALAAEDHQDVPFEVLVRELEPERDPQVSPLFQAMLAWRNAPAAPAELPGLELEVIEIANEEAKFDLTLTLAESGDGLAGSLEYRRALFDTTTMRRFLDRLARLAAAAVADPERPVAELPLAGAAERHTLLTEWNRPAGFASLAPDLTVTELLAVRREHSPEEVALVVPGGTWSCGELGDRVRRLAGYLRGLGVGPEVTVGLCLERGRDLVVALLAILEAGGVYVALDPVLPPARLAFTVDDTEARVLVTRESFLGRLPRSVAAVCLDRDPVWTRQESAAPPPTRLAPAHLAYVIHTSGSTGRPKGVAISHRSLVPTLFWARECLGLGGHTRVLHSLSPAFDFGIFEILTTLIFGGTFHMLRPDDLADPARYARYAATREIDTIHATPSFIRAVVAAGETLRGLAVLHLGGEALTGEYLEGLDPALDPACAVYNGYGPTEATINTTIFRVDRRRLGAATPIGRASANRCTYVVDGAGEPVPAGVAGELVVGGDGLARGYLHRGALTAERFVPDPFGCGRLYRTGDQVRHLAGGELEFLGRFDDQVKVRGFRVELGEIEAALLAEEEVAAAAVVDVPTPGDAADRRLVAFVVARREIAPAELRRRLTERLPAYMVPSALVELASLPSTPSGKVDRRALRRSAPAAGGDVFVAPATPTEEALAAIWSDLLGRESVGVHDDFFALGGHSLLAVRVASRIRDVLGAEIELRRLFERPTIAALAAAPELARARPPLAPVQPLLAVAEAGPAPLSSAQERLWFLDQLEPGGTAYHMPAVAFLTGPLRTASLHAALSEIVRRHQALRTRFEVADGEPVQIVEAPSPISLPRVDLGRLGEPRRRVVALARREARRPFDLRRGPLLRAVLVRLAAEEHALVAVLHHIVFDGWSTGVLLAELRALYAGESLPPLPIQYADYARWQRQWLSGEVLARQVEHWRRRLAGVKALELPTDRPRRAGASRRGATVPVRLPAALCRGLAELGRRRGATLFMTLLASFAALLGRLAGQSDVAVGTPVANRRRVEIEGLIGFFVNALTLRADLRGRPSFAELLRRTREAALDAEDHQDVPFETLVRELEPERDPQVSPLFQAMLALQNAPAGPAGMPGLALELVEIGNAEAKFDLTLTLGEDADALTGSLEYRRALFDATTIRRLLDRFERLAAAAVADPERSVAELPLLGRAERHEILAEWNDTAVPAEARFVHQLFALRASSTPAAIAVVCDATATELTYGELGERVSRLARALRSRGVGPDVRVGLAMERSVELVVAMLATLEAGGTYVPLDPEHPEERRAFVTHDAGVALLLSDTELREGAACHAPRRLQADHGAYLLYTSGSTGRPKGVLVTHRGLANHMRWMQAAFPLGPGDAVLQKTPATFDASVWEFFAPLVAGARLVLARPGGHREPAYLAGALVRHRVTGFQGVPTLLEAMAGEPGLEGLARLYSGGEALTADLARRLRRRTAATLINLYGPTEACIQCVVHRAGAAPPGAAVAIGRPISNFRALLLDRELSPVGLGASGQVALAGPGLARGYLGRPALTAEVFVPDPFACGSRLYLTGDRARYLSDGTLEYLGRLDRQLKIRGLRVEPAEIETVLKAQREVAAAAVVDAAGAAGQRVLVAYVAAEELRAADLRRRLEASLPPYMVPAAVVALDALPLLPSGKVDRGALRRRPLPESALTAEPVAPRSPAEELLAAIWCDVLGRERVGVHDDFFALGGHSLLATRVTSRIRDACGVELDLRRLFERPTIAGLAAEVAAARSADAAPPIEPGPRDGPLPLSFAQERLWFLDQLEPGATAYHIAAAAVLRGRLDGKALAAAWSEIVRRHGSLRTRFTIADGEPAQIVEAPADTPLARVDLTAVGDARGRALALAEREARRPFDLRRGPLLRAFLARLAADQHVLVAVLHHIVFDGWSTGVLLRELRALYGGRKLPPLPVQYSDYARWQRRWLGDATWERQLEHWRRRLAGVPVLELPTDRPRRAGASRRGATLPVRLPADLCRALAVLGRRRGATLFMTLLASFAALLGRHSGQREVAVGSPVANRRRSETEGLIGFFVNTLVLRVDLAGRPSFAELLRRARATALAAEDHQDVPFERLVRELEPERDPQVSPLFQAMLALQNAAAVPAALPGLELELIGIGNREAKFDLTLTLTEGGEGLTGALEYRRALFDATTMRRLLDRFARLAAAAAADPERTVAELPLVGPAERHEVLTEWSHPAGAAQYRPHLTVTELLADRWERSPEAVALVFPRGVWSYRELQRRVHRLARHLRGRGVGPEVTVGLCLERGPDLIVALLAILEAGGVYVALDQDLPAARLEFMVDDTGALLLVTRESLLGRLPSGVSAVCLDRDGAALCQEPAIPPPAGLEGAHLAYVIYTSGSTGRPKGVAISHQSLTRTLLWARECFGFGSHSRVLHTLSPTFDFGVFEILTTVLFGGTFHVLCPDDLADPERYARYAAARNVDTIHATPSFIRSVVAAGETLRGLDVLHLGGEALTREYLEGLFPALDPGCAVYNGYGPTEATINTTIFRVDGRRLGAATPIGRASASHRTYVVGGAGDPVPVGVPGELVVGGDGLARGYLHRGALTAERFVPDPFRGGRLYRTGDRVRHLAGGELEFLGRFDEQVKVRGFRVELGEVEAALAGDKGVAAAAVVDVDGPGGAADRRLVAFVVPRQELAPAELRLRLEERLPAYMVPSTLVELPSLPSTPSGKVDRRALRRSAPAAEGEGAFAAPRTATEETVAAIWCDVLGRERVGIHDDFFALGGHSLLATRVASRIRDALRVELDLRRLFERPTIAALAAEIEAALGGRAAPPIEPAPRDPDGTAPPSFAQERLWFLHQLAPESPAYNVPAAVRLDGPLDVAALGAAFAAMIARHETLRTRFADVRGRPRQVIAEPGPHSLPVVDLADHEAQVARLASEEAARPFDLARGPLLRTVLLSLAENRHVLLLTLHHIVSDGASVGVLLREIEAFYGGRGAALPALPVQYADYARWQRRWLQGETLARLLGHWRRYLTGLEELELPADRPRHRAAAEAPAATFPVTLPDVRLRARRAGATPFMTLATGLSALLSRLAGLTDVAFGTPIANRNRLEIEGLIGFFVNTLVLRLDLAGDPSFSTALARTREAALEAYGHQDLPFDKLVAELAPERGPGGATPFFRVMLALQNAAGREIRLPGLAADAREVANAVAKLDLVLALEERPGSIGGWLEYRRDLFDATTMRRFAAQFARLLTVGMADPSLRLSELPLLGDGERWQILGEWNDSAAAFPSGRSLAELFAEHAARRPDAVALVAADSAALTYRALDRRTNRRARQLAGLGVEAETPVGIALERSAAFVEAVLAVIKAGGVYVPLDPSYPEQRRAFMVADAGVRLVLGRRELEAGESDCFSAEPLARPTDPAALAYVIYTSGSTGRPKGIAVAHRAVVRLVLGTDYVELAPGDRVAHASNTAFDAATFEIWGALATGGCLVVISPETALDPAVYARQLAAQRVGALFVTTALFNEICRQVPRAFGGLGHLLFGGEAVDPRRVRQVLEAAPPRRLLHVYGPTECTTYSTWHRVREVAPRAATVPIGQPLANGTAFVVDRRRRLQPPGVPGELLIGGHGLARGYVRRPALTAAAFVPDSLSGAVGGRLYATGDLVRRRAGGAVEFLGRIDHQVKLRGFRIELGEIESALNAHPGIADAVALLREVAPGDRRLAAYFVPSGAAGRPSGAELRAYLESRLPPFMVPTAFVERAALPLNPNGKVDRRALAAEPLPAGVTGIAERRHVAPRNATEELVAGIWSEVLGVERVGVHDGFFELGGHSLLATQVVARIREACGVDLELMRLFDRPTVAALAAEIGALRAGGAGPSGGDITLAPRGGDLPLSFAQERLWFLQQLDPVSPAYNVPAAVRLRGPLSIAALAAGLREIARRHETLRTTYRARGGEPRQQINDEAAVPLPTIDLSALPRPHAELEERLGAGARRPFDLAADPPLRVALLRLGADHHVLQLTMHHIASDGWSVAVFLRELKALYGAFLARRSSPLPELEIQYADYALWQRAWLEGAVLEGQLAYWRERLGRESPRGEPPLLELPFDRPRHAVALFHGSVCPLALPPPLADALRRQGRRHGATLFMMLLAALQSLLARWSGQSDVTVGAPVAGRRHIKAEPLIGFFVNTLALRGDLTGDPPFTDHLGRVRQTTLGAYDHQDVPFEKLVEELQPRRESTLTPFFQVVLALHDARRETLELPGIEAESLTLGSVTAKFDLTFMLAETESGVEGEVEYSTELFDSTTVRRLLRGFELLVEGVAAAPARRLSELPVLGAAERHELLAEWNDTAVALPRDACVHELFEDVAWRRPDAVALACGGVETTYGELDARAERLAAALRRLGVGADVPVGLRLERSLEAVVAILGVLKAGGAYLPLDPAYPEPRLELMLEDSGAPLVLVAGSDSLLPVAQGLEVRRVREASPCAARPGRIASPQQLAYVMYTSGSTGRPKGVAVTHRNVVRLVRGADFMRMDGGETFLQFAPIAFDAATLEIWAPLANGGRLVIPPPGPVSLAELGATLVRQRVSSLWLTANLFQHLAMEERAGLGGVAQLLAGGDVLPPAQVAAVLRDHPRCRLSNGYGPTENTTFTCCYPISRIGPSIPIGRPISSTRVYVTDATMREVPIGVAGELVTAGEGVARGYLARPALTAERFVPDPFSGDAGGRLYRVGDRVRLLGDGLIEFLGRFDHQVKLRGFRIELGEIEAAIARHPAVRQAVALVVGTEPKRLVAFVVAAAGEVEIAALRDSLGRALPDYMVPAAFVALDALPLNPNGKVDRAALSRAALGSVDEALRAEVPYVAPQTDLEETLASVWSEVLGAGRLGIDDNFFEAGGNSLAMARLASRLEAALGRPVPIVDLFRFPTVRSLARHLGGGGSDAQALSGVDETARRRREAMSQRRRRRTRPS